MRLLFTLALSITSLSNFSHEKLETTRVKASHRKIYTEINIDASPKEVWGVLTDFKSYGNWAKFFKGMTCEIKDNGAVTATFKINPKKDKLKHFDHILY